MGSVVIVNDRLPAGVFGTVSHPKRAMYRWLTTNVEPPSGPPVISNQGMLSGSSIIEQTADNLKLRFWESTLTNTLKRYGETEPSYIRDGICATIIYHQGESGQWEYYECFYYGADAIFRQTIAVVQDEMKAMQMKLSVD